MSDTDEWKDTLVELGTSDGKQFSVDANLIATGRTCVLGSSGSGKSYAVGVLCEELCRNEIPFAIVDTEGEHTGLKERFEAIWVGEEEGSDLKWANVDFTSLADQAPDIAPLILDVSDLQDQREKVGAFIEALYHNLSVRRTPYLIVVEEADKFIPQYGQRVPIFAEVARRGRKRGMGLMICSQRPSLVDKNVLSQCGNQLIGKLIIQNDLQSVAQFFPGKGLPKELTALKAGQFFAMGGFSPAPSLIMVKKRATRPGGGTPLLTKRVVRRYTGLPDRTIVSRAQDEEVHPPSSKKSALGLAASVKLDDIPAMVRRERSFGIFGPREAVTAITPELRTMLQVGVKTRRGLLKRRLETAYFWLDGVTGKGIIVERGLRLGRGFERLLGLSMLQAEVLRDLKPDSDSTAIDIASSMGESRTRVSRVLNYLNDRRLVRIIEVGKRKMYRRLTELPSPPSGTVPLELEQVEVGRTKVVQSTISEADLREVVKGLWEGSDLDSFETFLYPLFRVELVVKRKRRVVLVDGRNGRELRF